ncbi:MAG: AAA family ATPase [Deltaproteobacteria bacterium]|nr:AAA family ATPase [Deltaproteobacteria bacterium]MCB9478906.1 AAA family ATPase [Deltaproteobacteria bacterium]MCB9489412.1 AAA family ATPase [Deltaproteobacteria bacterium]
MSYLEHYGLRYEPFSNAPDSRFFWSGENFERAAQRLRFAVESRRGLAVCAGPMGHGKTTLARRMYDEMPSKRFAKGLLVVIHSDVTAEWLLRKIAGLLGVRDVADQKLDVLGQIYTRLREIDSEGRTAVILIDEAQMLSRRELMEEFRGLLNIEIQGRKLINFVFFGLPELEHTLALDEPLKNRVAVKVNLGAFRLDMTKRYVAFRLKTAGGNPMLFGPEVLQAIQKFSKGTPRLINTICDNLLLDGHLSNTQIFTLEMVEQIADDLGLTERDAMAFLDTLLGTDPSKTLVNQNGKVETDWDVLAKGSLDEILTFLDK